MFWFFFNNSQKYVTKLDRKNTKSLNYDYKAKMEIKKYAFIAFIGMYEQYKNYHIKEYILFAFYSTPLETIDIKRFSNITFDPTF